MKISVNSQLLAQELRLLSRVIPDKPTIPVLANVLFMASDALTLRATNLQVQLVTQCPATIDVPGSVTLPAKKLLEMVEQFQNADVQITLDKGQVHVVCGAFRSRLQTLPATDFPALPIVEKEISTLPTSTLFVLIGRVKYAIAAKVQKFVMDGALLALTGDVMAMVTTDGKRLSLSTASRAAGADLSLVIPSETLDVLTALVGEELTFSTGPRHLFFTVGSRLLVSRMMDGKFPNYDRIIPRENTYVMTVNRSLLAAAIRRVNSVSEQDLAVYLSLSGDLLSLTSKSAAIGDAYEDVLATYTGPDLKLCVNGQYLLDFLGASRGEFVTLSVKDAKTALLAADGEDFINVIMPMRAS